MQKKENKTKKYVMPRSFLVEVHGKEGKICVAVNGVISIIDFNESTCVLKVRRGKLSIRGSDLCVAVFENNTVEISGNIEGVDLV